MLVEAAHNVGDNIAQSHASQPLSLCLPACLPHLPALPTCGRLAPLSCATPARQARPRERRLGRAASERAKLKGQAEESGKPA